MSDYEFFMKEIPQPVVFQQQRLEDIHRDQCTANLLESINNATNQAGLQHDQPKDFNRNISCGSVLKGNASLELPFPPESIQIASSPMESVRVPEFYILIPTSMPPHSRKELIMERLSTFLDSLLSLDLGMPHKITTNSKRAIETHCLPDTERDNMLKRKYVPEVAIDPSLVIINCDSSPNVSEYVQDHAPFSKTQRRNTKTFTVAEVELLINAIETLGIGRWQEIKLKFFKDRTCSQLKDKWRSLVKTANTATERRRGRVISGDLLCRVLATEIRKMKAHKIPL